jgi:alkylhydroperoxidase family enzyme
MTLPWMPPTPDRSALSTDDQAAFDAVAERELRKYGSLGGYFGGMLNAPSVAEAISHLGHVIRSGASADYFTNAERELIDMVLAVEMDQAAVFAGHLPDAIAYGVRPEAVQAICDRDMGPLTPDERLLVEYILGVWNGTVTQDAFAQLTARFGSARSAVAYTVACGFLIMTFRLMSAFGFGPGPVDVSLLAPYLNGTATIVPPPPGRAS